MNINVDFKKISITREAEEHFLTIKESAHQEDVTILSVYALNNIASNYMKGRPAEKQANPRSEMEILTQLSQ